MHSLGPGTKIAPSVLIGWADALSTVPWGGRALAYMFPRRLLLDRLYPPLWVGVQIWKAERDRWEVFSLGVASSVLGRSASPNHLLALAKARALSKQWVVPRGQCARAGRAVSVWRATGAAA